MKRKRILLTILPLFWPKMPPIGLGYLQGFLKKNGIEADILDLNNAFFNLSDSNLRKKWLISCNLYLEHKILRIIKNNHFLEYRSCIEKILSYDVVGFSCFKSNFKATLEVISELKSKKADIKIILGGPEITRQFFKGHGGFDSKIRQLADFLVVGEGEGPLCDYLNGKKGLENISKFNQLNNLDKLPFPTYDGTELSSYLKRDTIPVQFTRGCIRKCNFCSERMLYKGFRARRVQSLIDEIRYHKINNNVNYFVFFDSLINGDIKKLEDLCDSIIENFGSVNWEAQITIRDDMGQRLLEKMKKSGCYNLFVGLESGTDRTLKNMNKGFRAKDAVSFFKKLKKSRLFFGISIIVGYPGETVSDFKKSLNFVIQNKDIIPKIEQVNPFVYYDGTAADKNGDYKLNKKSLERMNLFIEEIKRNNLRYTNAFLGNLIEKDVRI